MVTPRGRLRTAVRRRRGRALVALSWKPGSDEDPVSWHVVLVGADGKTRWKLNVEGSHKDWWTCPRLRPASTRCSSGAPAAREGEPGEHLARRRDALPHAREARGDRPQGDHEGALRRGSLIRSPGDPPPATRAPLVLGPLLLLGALEVAARVLASRDSRFNVFIGGSREFDPRRGQRLKRGYRSGEIHTSWLRDPRARLHAGEASGHLPRRRPRELVLLHAAGAPVARGPRGAASREARLDLRGAAPAGPPQAPYNSVEVVNAACPGYDSSQARSSYEDEIAPGWEHDALVVYVGWNDLAPVHARRPRLQARGARLPRGAENLLQRAVSASYLLRSFYVVQGYLEKRGAVRARTPLDAEEERRAGLLRAHPLRGEPRRDREPRRREAGLPSSASQA